MRADVAKVPASSEHGDPEAPPSLDAELSFDCMRSFRTSCPPAFAGRNGYASGGWLALVAEQALGDLAAEGGFGSTAECLECRYLAPAPVGPEIVVVAWLDGRQREWQYVSAELRLAESGAVVGSAWGSFSRGGLAEAVGRSASTGTGV